MVLNITVWVMVKRSSKLYLAVNILTWNDMLYVNVPVVIGVNRVNLWDPRRRW